METSILLTTFNGEKYILEQLESIKQQTLPADEVIIIDDASSDNTAKMIESYITKNNLSTWILIVNKKNIGWRKNFFEGFKLCKGDYVFPCDQDDIWHPEKIEKMVTVMRTNPDIDLLACEYIPFYEQGEKLKNYQKRKFDNKIITRNFDSKWIYVNYPGCTYCFRRKFFEMLCPTWDTKYAHDAVLYRMALLVGKFAVINMPLIKFRRHQNSATSQSERRFTKKEREKEIEYIEDLCDKYYASAPNDEIKCVIKKTKEFARGRLEYLRNPSIGKGIKLLLNYHGFYSSIKGWIADIFLAIQYTAY